ncbi:hypothetical protein COT51_00900 [candidate division WWE3 bacterium CG08_land_8_20_14_0_20_41_15]|uniref:DUF6922 domain-containing protein n=1 Tax=candidate division WWE3 bacterium CG08_land_8_20_14_0_20_41_15 TaxID=1975086 RepID=A0A2H0XA48_UNCKA|nr:MAG: hypothetical protein COT51_00900 [candidate division WWE3 bacterium CG08_land_8_20_14_0_20_41_15]
MGNQLLKNLNQGVVWSSEKGKLDKERDKVYIIHQTFMYGTLEDIKNLFEIYSKDEIKDVFVETPLRIYTPPAFNFIKNYVLELGLPLLEESYVKTAL